MMSWNNVLPESAEAADRSAAELLEEGRALFGELAEADEHQAQTVRRLRLITMELDARAARLAPPGTLTCACGETFAAPEDLDDHFLDVFVPDNDIARDGRLHAEV